LTYKASVSNEIKQLIDDLKNKQYLFSIIPKNIMHMNNGIKYYYVEAECNDTKVIINAYSEQAEELFKEVHKHSLLKSR
jgi:hypothetical protein